MPFNRHGSTLVAWRRGILKELGFITGSAGLWTAGSYRVGDIGVRGRYRGSCISIIRSTTMVRRCQYPRGRRSRSSHDFKR